MASNWMKTWNWQIPRAKEFIPVFSNNNDAWRFRTPGACNTLCHVHDVCDVFCSKHRITCAPLETGSEDTTSSMQCNRGPWPVSQHWLLQQRYQSTRCYDREKLSSEDWEALLVSGARVGSTNEEGGKSLNQPITMLDRSSSSNSICTAPMNDLWSIRP